MRGEKGKLICIWSPVLHGEGCSTLACSIGFCMQYYTGRRVLIINNSNCTSHMEKYLERDIEIKYSMDNLKIFNGGIRKEHILTYATHVNEGLYMVAGTRFNKEITRESMDFDRLFMDKCLEAFDLVIADMDTGVREENKLYLNCADKIMAVFSPNEIIADELYSRPELQAVLKYFRAEKTFHIVNKLYEGWDTGRVLERYKNKYSLPHIFGLDYDGDVLNACCTDKAFYSFLIRELKRDRNIYIRQLTDICEYLARELCMNNKTAECAGYGSIFKKLLRSSLY